jgi:glycosyltransferase involved in cell wall biosynthesis
LKTDAPAHGHVSPGPPPSGRAALAVHVVARAGLQGTGTSRYTSGLFDSLRSAGADVQLLQPDPPPIPAWLQRGMKRLGWDLAAFFSEYPLSYKRGSARIVHLTSQTLATVVPFRKHRARIVISVLDVIPFVLRHDRRFAYLRNPLEQLFYRMALAGLKRADLLVAVSDYTRRQIVEVLRLPADRVQVVYPVLDPTIFHPIAETDGFRAAHALDRDSRYLLYVGSEDPRKNLPTLIRAFAEVKRHRPDVKLLKVGAPHFAAERSVLRSLVEQLGLTESVIFFDHVDETALPLLYNVADIFVMPSLYEGFGLPVVEAMACGTPVVSSGATSLPEAAGDAALLVDPGRPEEFAERILHLLQDGSLRSRLRESGLQNVRRFLPARIGAQLLDVYHRLL